MEFKSNFNKLHYLLTEKYEDVSVEEKYNPEFGNYIQLTIKEKLECKVIIPKKNLEKSQFQWLYLANPMNEDGSVVSMVSSIDEFANDIKLVIDNKRFDSDYLITKEK